MTLGRSDELSTLQIASPLADMFRRARVMPITIDQYHQMIVDRIVPEDSTVELLYGVLVLKDRSAIGDNPMGQSPLHILVMSLLADLAARIRTDRWHMKLQVPIACPPDGEPEPDACIVARLPRDYESRLAGPGDVTCVIEAAHSSLERDRQEKLPIYAAAGIPQYVILNLQNRTAEVYELPDPAGAQYRSRVTLEAGETLKLRLPEGVFAVMVSELLP